MTEKIGKYLNIDSSAVSAILREKAYLWYKNDAINLPEEQKQKIIQNFRDIFNIPINKDFDEKRYSTGLTEEEYFYSLCIAASHGRGIEAALGRYFNKHKSFLSNGIKNGTRGKAYNALQKFNKLTKEEIMSIGEEKFQEWDI
jgi:hypothetical protein